MRPRVALLWLVLLVTLAGCDATEFPPAERVDKDRPLAGRVMVDGDPTRATPGLGERASYQFLVGSPGVQVTWTYALTVCRFAHTESGVGVCDPALPPLTVDPLEAKTALPPDDLPSVSFVVPGAAELASDENELLVQGLLCPNSPLDPALLSALQMGDVQRLLKDPNPCLDKSKNGLLVASPFRIERTQEDRNHTPSITTSSWSMPAMKDPIVTGTSWSSVATASSALGHCAGTGLLELPAGKQTVGLQLELDAAARETYLEPSAIAGQAGRTRTEVPYVEGLASAGKFKIVRDNLRMSNQVLQLEWEPPTEPIDPGGLLVRFWLLASDDRLSPAQSASWLERALCVVPQAK
ncbi:MAG: hypothetical protein JWN48_5546 [Myxococcaceae bacterium]|nr:hypothetical protein [Myxococcaceae bacterium]